MSSHPLGLVKIFFLILVELQLIFCRLGRDSTSSKYPSLSAHTLPISSPAIGWDGWFTIGRNGKQVEAVFFDAVQMGRCKDCLDLQRVVLPALAASIDPLPLHLLGSLLCLEGKLQQPSFKDTPIILVGLVHEPCCPGNGP